MITLSKSGNSVTFTFDENSGYLQNGTIDVPVNSLALITDESDMATFRKAASNDIFISARYAEFGKTKAELEAWYKENMVGSTGGGVDSGTVQTMIDTSTANYFDNAEYDSGTTRINFYHGNTVKVSLDASAFVIDGMIDDVRIETISGVTYLVIDFNTASGKEDIQIPLTDIFDPSNYYTKTEVDASLSGKADTTAVTEAISAATDDMATKTWVGEQGYLTEHQSLSAYSTTEEVNSAITEATSGKLDTSTFETYSGSVETALSGKQDTLSAGRAISISSNTVALDLPISAGTGTNSIQEGNFTTASGPSSHAEGFGTSATTFASHAEGESTLSSGLHSHAEGSGTTASNNASHAEGTGTLASGNSSHAEGTSTLASSNSSHAEGYSTKASGLYSHAEGNNTIASGPSSHAEGYYTSATTEASHAEGLETIVNNDYEHASGMYNVSNTGSTTADKTLFSVGNGTSYSARHNAFEIRKNGDIYISSGNTDIKLQDNLGGVSESAFTAYTAATDASLSGKQDTLVSGTNIKTINNESLLGSGNIDIQGGGKAIEAGRGISITTGETADTVSFNLPISAGTGANSLKIAGGTSTIASGSRSIAVGNNSHASGIQSIAINQSYADGQDSFSQGTSNAKKPRSSAFGQQNYSNNDAELSCGQYNNSVSASTTFGDSGNTLFSVGNGTANNARHNAFEIRQNGDIYLSLNGQDVKLQDTITATAANTTALGGLSLVKLTQSEYDNLSTKDNSTLYVIVN